MSARDILLFALQDSRDFGEGVATRLATTLSDLEESDFEDGEHKARPVEDVSGREVFVIQSLFSDNRHSVNDKLCRLLFLIGALKDARAASVTAVIPYLCYARQDRKAQPQEPISSRYVAQLLEAMGTDRLIVMDVHDLAALENAFRCPTDHLEAFPLFVEHFAALLGSEPAVVVSPDIGGTRRALRFSSAFAEACHSEIDTAFVEKHRSGGTIKSGAFAGKIEGRSAIIIDDLISTGGTILRAARACREHGARRIFAVATHGIFTVEANAVMASDLLKQVVITNTGPIYRIDPELVGKKVVILDATPLLGQQSTASEPAAAIKLQQTVPLQPTTRGSRRSALKDIILRGIAQGRVPRGRVPRSGGSSGSVIAPRLRLAPLLATATSTSRT